MDIPLHVLLREKDNFVVTPFPVAPAEPKPDSLPEAKEVVYSPTGSCFATVEGENHAVFIRDGITTQVLNTFGGLKDEKTPLKVSYMCFSPKGTYILVWARPMPNVNVPNLVVYEVATGDYLGGFYQKVFHRDFWPYVQWSDDETIACKSVTNTLHFFAGNDFMKTTSKLGVPGVTQFALSKGEAPYTIAVFIGGKSGAPGRYALYNHPDQGGEQLMNRTAFKADAVDFKWNSRGTALLALASTNVDSSGKSYYGQSEVYFMNKRGSVCKKVELPQEGPTYDCAWSPSGNNFILIYGFMPARATMWDDRCDPVFDFGTGSWNTIIFSPHGRYVALGGFGSLAGRVEFWDSLKNSVVGRVELPCTTEYSWSPCSRYFLGATTYPRLREGNGYKIARIDGQIIHHVEMKESHLYQATFRPGDSKKLPDPMTINGEMIGGPMQKPGGRNSFNSTNGAKKSGVYRPPGSRGASASFSLHDHVKAGKVDKSTFMKTSNGNGLFPNAKPLGPKIIPGMDPADYEKAPSKSARRRNRKKDKGEKEEIEMKVEIPALESLAVAEKKVKALTKKLRQIQKLQESLDEGKNLKEEQMVKLGGRPKIEKELEMVNKLIEQGTFPTPATT